MGSFHFSSSSDSSIESTTPSATQRAHAVVQPCRREEMYWTQNRVGIGVPLHAAILGVMCFVPSTAVPSYNTAML